MSLASIKIVRVIQTFSTVEINRLDKFIHSPYFNVNPLIVEFFDLIVNSLKVQTLEEWSREDVRKQLSHEAHLSDARFRKLCSDLLKLVEEFLAIEQFKQNPLHEASYLMEAISKRNMEPLYNSVLKSARRLSERQSEISASYYYYQYEIEKNHFNMLKSEMKRDTRLNLEQIAKNLDLFYMAEKLRYYSTALSQKYVVTQEYNLLFMDEILTHLKSHKYEDTPQITLNLAVLKVYKYQDNNEYYYQLKNEMFKNIDKFPQLEARDIFYAALNFCIQKINMADQNFLKEAFDLYEHALQKDYLYINGELTPWTFKNIVVLALRLKEYQWVEKFIKEYCVYLNPEHRENAVTFNLAKYYYHIKDYEKVLELLREVEFDDISYALGSKATLLATYYDLDEIDALFSFLSSFRVFLNRKKNQLPDFRRKNYLNLIKFTQKLISINPGNREAVAKLRKEIEASKNVADINWLREKIAELGK